MQGIKCEMSICTRSEILCNQLLMANMQGDEPTFEARVVLF